MYRLATQAQRKYYNEFMYPWQDEIFAMIQSRKFYLTGGTCLSRFYYQHRYSDDLDFFFDGINYTKEEFEIEFREIYNRIAHKYKALLKVNSESFKRIILESNKGELKIEFIFEPVAFINKRIETDKGILIDTKENIFGNKITALYGRKAFKDYIDLYFLMKDFRLEDGIKWSEEKMVPIDYEGATFCLLDGQMHGDVWLLKKIDTNDFEMFTKNLITDLLNYAKTL